MVTEAEDDFQRWVTDFADWHGWAWYHVTDSRKTKPGFPDLVLVRERVLYRELKTDTGRLTPEQAGWLNRLTAAGADAGVWRPRDRAVIEKELQ